MRKSIALFIMATLLLPMLTFAVPVNASTGHPGLAGFDGSNLYPATTSVNVTAGQIDVDAIDNVAGDWGNLTIIFYNSSLTNPLLIDFSGAQFDLYMSPNGYSNLTSDDVLYASGFMVSDLNLPFGGQTYTQHNSRLLNGVGKFDLGYINQSGVIYKILTGPIPFDITNEYKFIKIFDGSATLIAAAGIINILPAIDITPDYGPACAEINMTGVALAPNRLYNITFSNVPALAAQVYTDAYGKFTVTFNAHDFGNDHCEDGYEQLCIEVIDTVTTAVIEHLHFGEISREIWNIVTTMDDATFSGGEYGNGTGMGGCSTYPCVDAHIFDNLWINGDHWCPTSDIVIMIDNIVLGTYTANATGYFNATGMTVPVLTMGPHNLTVNNGDFFYQYCIYINPTLVVQPTSGPCGTELEFLAYGFPEGMAYLYWYGMCYEDDTYFWIENATVGADGQFNMTVDWTAPSSYGGSHVIRAFSSYHGKSFVGIVPSEISSTTFTVVPSLYVTPDPVVQDGSLFTVFGCGLDPTVGYYPDTSAQEFNPYTLYSDCCGQLEVNIVAAGLRPGLNSFALYTWGGQCSQDGSGVYTPAVYTTFTVSSEGDPIYELVNGSIGTIDSISNDVATINTNVGTLLTTVDALNATIIAIDGDVAAIQTALGTMQASLDAIGLKVTALNGTAATIQTSLGTLQGTVTSMNGDIATIKTDLGTVKANVASVKGFLPVDMTPVWIAVVLSLIAAIAAIYSIVVIRSKIAA